MALAKKCDRCRKLYEHYPVGNKAQFNAIRALQRNTVGDPINGYTTYDFCPECMDEVVKFMAERRISDGKDENNAEN